MVSIKIPYSTTYMEAILDESRVAGILTSGAHRFSPQKSQEEIVRDALDNPIDSAALRELARTAGKILIITSDHTRPVPSSIALPIILSEIRSANPTAIIRILIATGFHRPTTVEEMKAKFGSELAAKETIINHDSKDLGNMVFKGIMPSGGELWLNSMVDWADLVISEGFIEPHFFAGFSGGRKSILPGIASERTVMANHCSEFIASREARTGNLKNNPIHKDMLFAAKAAGLKFILNVAIDAEKRIIAAFAGHPEKAHTEGCKFVGGLAGVKKIEADIVITSNGGYPLDQNIYQAVKGMTAAEACVRKGGVIIMAAACSDGHGGKAFYKWIKNAASIADLIKEIEKIPREKTEPDQWEVQILARVLLKCTVIMVADRSAAGLITDMHMLYAESISKALEMADGILGGNAKITVIPDGVGVIVE